MIEFKVVLFCLIYIRLDLKLCLLYIGFGVFVKVYVVVFYDEMLW